MAEIYAPIDQNADKRDGLGLRLPVGHELLVKRLHASTPLVRHLLCPPLLLIAFGLFGVRRPEERIRFFELDPITRIKPPRLVHGDIHTTMPFLPHNFLAISFT